MTVNLSQYLSAFQDARTLRASTRSIFCFASATAISLYGAKVRSADPEMSGKSTRVA
jgi:hypothetical protein